MPFYIKKIAIIGSWRPFRQPPKGLIAYHLIKICPYYTIFADEIVDTLIFVIFAECRRVDPANFGGCKTHHRLRRMAGVNRPRAGSLERLHSWRRGRKRRSFALTLGVILICAKPSSRRFVTSNFLQRTTKKGPIQFAILCSAFFAWPIFLVDIKRFLIAAYLT